MVALKKVQAVFFETPQGTKPVREWLKALPAQDRRIVGNDIATIEYGWPIGMPLCRPLGAGLWEVRSALTGGRIARVLFMNAHGYMVLLHAFVKKTQKTPPAELDTARKRMKEMKP